MSVLRAVIVAPARALFRTLQSHKPQVSAIRKVVTGAILVPVFGVVLILLRLRAILAGPLSVRSRANDGIEINCMLPDLIQMYICFFGVWEPDLTEYIKGRLDRGDTCIDIGANIGYFSLLAARQVGATGRVVAIEASPTIFARLSETLAANHDVDHVRPVHVAASDAPGELTIFAGPLHNTGLTTSQANRSLQQEAVVPARPLREILTPEEINSAKVIKIDVEGGEPAVLRGMVDLLPDLPDNVVILVEISPLWWDDETLTIDDVLQPFMDAGFVMYEIPNNYWPWRYLWPRDVKRPQRLRALPRERVKRIDLVLSRLDREEL